MGSRQPSPGSLPQKSHCAPQGSPQSPGLSQVTHHHPTLRVARGNPFVLPKSCDLGTSVYFPHWGARTNVVVTQCEAQGRKYWRKNLEAGTEAGFTGPYDARTGAVGPHGCIDPWVLAHVDDLCSSCPHP